MIVQDKMKDKMCSFYVSDFHLEMILIPFINKKIENKEKIIILTEKNLESTLKILIEKVNIKESNKKEILNLNWEPKVKNNIESNSNIIIIGTKKYIEEQNKKIENSNIKNINIIDCYNFEEIKEEITNISCKYKKSLNTLGNNNF